MSLHKRGYKSKAQFISIEVRNSGVSAIEYTQRTRSFLFACLAVGIAQMFGKDRFSFYENGVVSLNLPITKDILESRATRTTHPRVINGFSSIFSLVFNKNIAIDCPFQWLTKKEVTQKISQHGFEGLLCETNSCTRTLSSSKAKTHCGACSQCLDRRVAILAAGLEGHDDSEKYRIDLLTGDRSLDKDIVMAASYVKFALQFAQLSKEQFISEHPQIASALREFDNLTTAQAEEKIFQLFKQHSEDVVAVINRGFDVHRDKLTAAANLSSGCLMALSFNRNKIEAAIPSGYDEELQRTLAALPTRRCQFYVGDKSIVFKGGYTLSGSNYNLVNALLDNFRKGKKSSEDVLYMTVHNLVEILQIDEASLRKAVGRLRDATNHQLAVDQGIVLEADGFIQNSPRFGYRLNPLLKEVSALADLDD